MPVAVWLFQGRQYVAYAPPAAGHDDEPCTLYELKMHSHTHLHLHGAYRAASSLVPVLKLRGKSESALGKPKVRLEFYETGLALRKRWVFIEGCAKVNGTQMQAHEIRLVCMV
jgi:hypothetical protein